MLLDTMLTLEQIWYSRHFTRIGSSRLNSVLLHQHRQVLSSPTFQFSLISSVGAALWAADIESNNTQMTEMTTPKSHEAKKAE
jgi:hypothetical protein